MACIPVFPTARDTRIMPRSIRSDKKPSSINQKKRPREGALSGAAHGRGKYGLQRRPTNQRGESDYFIVTLTPEAEPTLSDRPFEVVPIVMITPFSFFRCSMPAPAPAAPPVLNTV